ncbi:MAG: redox-sensing transcriptional repressor Rex [Bacteroidales bacterium]|jgi:redox-sensing transcriptional repressor|nr:redox-sensing transcriptional repressor Rex [Bacteroidales bacterium]
MLVGKRKRVQTKREGLKEKTGPVPEPTLYRLPVYLSYLRLAKKSGLRYVSSTLMAKEMGIDATQVTKDFSHTEIVGKTRVGYEVDKLIGVLETFLRFNTVDYGYVFGAGSLGTALLLDHGLEQFGFKIRGAFDVSDTKVGLHVGGVQIYHLDDFERVKDDDVKIGILTVPADEAQRVADIMVKGGIRAIWNFTSVRIRAPKEVVVQNTSLYAHLAVIFNRLHVSMTEDNETESKEESDE